MRSKVIVTMLLAVVAAGCGDGEASSSTTRSEATVEQYCAVLAGAHERASEETIELLLDLDYPPARAVLEPIERREVDAEDFQALAEFNDATCGVMFP